MTAAEDAVVIPDDFVSCTVLFEPSLWARLVRSAEARTVPVEWVIVHAVQRLLGSTVAVDEFPGSR